MLKRADRSDLYLKGIATINAENPAVLSPALLSVSGDILLKLGNLDQAEAHVQAAQRPLSGTAMFADAGPVGLGYVALARKQPAEALKIFDNALDNNPGTSRFKETTARQARGAGRARPIRTRPRNSRSPPSATRPSAANPPARRYRPDGPDLSRTGRTKPPVPEAKMELLKKAHGTYNRVYIAYKSTPEVCAEAGWQAYETLIEMGDQALADETLKALANDPKLQEHRAGQEGRRNWPNNFPNP